MRDGKYINFEPIPVLDYFKKENLLGEFWNGIAYQNITFQPRIEDLEYHRTFKFEDLTFRGTIEFRSCCCQPISDSMTVPAFHIGLITVLDQLKKLIDDDLVLFNRNLEISKLRQLFCRGEVPDFIDKDELQDLVLAVLNLAQAGLEKRGFDEAHFLEPLYNRAKRNTNPALEYLEAISKNVPLKDIVLKYATID